MKLKPATLLLLLFASVFLLPVTAGQDSASAAAKHPTCTTCEGKGRAVLPCDVCEGDGKAPRVDCAHTGGVGIKERQLALLREIDPEKAKQLEDALEELETSMQDLAELVGGTLASPTPGNLRCPAGCRKGVSFLNRSHACKVCKKKGAIQCAGCRGKGEAKCEPCKGKRTRELVCPECSARGTAPDPLSRTERAATCPWCEDSRLLACGLCDAGQLEHECATCRGAGDVVCRTCAGTTNACCNKCSGTGDLSSYFAAKKSNDCDKCRRKGVLDCTKCKKGRLECATCKGNGRHTGPCTACLGQEKAPCAGCTMGSDLAWTTTGERLAAAGLGPAALAHFDVAISRAEARNEERIRVYVGTAKERAAYTKELGKEVKAVKKRRATLAKKLGL